MSSLIATQPKTPFLFLSFLIISTSNDCIIRDLPTLDKGTLGWGDDLVEKRHKPIFRDLGEKAVADIAKTYVSELIEALMSFHFGNESDICVIELLEDITPSHEGADRFFKINLYNITKLLVE